MGGKVYLVGAGPGDGGLLTLKGLAVLEKADVVVHDALIGAEVMGLIPVATRRINVGKHAGSHPVPQERINQLLLEEALAGNCVARLKGGDPFVFGRGGEELELLAEHNIPFEIVPGITAAAAVPAYAGIPVTHRDYASSLHIITAHRRKGMEPDLDFPVLAKLKGTLVFLMGVASLGYLRDGLVQAGMDPSTPGAVVEQGTTSRQRRITGPLSQLPELAASENIVSPAVIVVGPVCALAQRFQWAEKRPLHGKRILVTRPAGQASRLADALRELGAEVVLSPTIRIAPIGQNTLLDSVLEGIGSFQWLACTSPTGVNCLFQALERRHYDVRRLGNIQVAAIGSATAKAFQRHGIFTDLVPETYNAAALGIALGKRATGKVLILRAKEGSPDLNRELEQARVSYADVPLYETLYERQAEARLEDMDFVTFTSASTVEGFQRAYGRLPGVGEICAVCIGASTARAAENYGMRVVVAREASIASMVERMVELCQDER